MSDPYIGEIRMFGGTFAPLGWAFCDGQLIAIAENDTLFNLLGTTYGGDGQSTFALPDLRGRVPMHMNNNHPIAESAGTESVTLTNPQMPVHNHAVLTSQNPGSASTPSDKTIIADEGPAGITQITTYKVGGAGQQGQNGQIVTPRGGSQPHTNIQPSLGINYILSLYGVYPSQN